MQWIIAGLGNPDPEYKSTRHNVGRDFVEIISKDFSKKAKFVTLEVYMNNSGAAIRKFVPSKKAAGTLAVVHDDLDMPLGSVKISYGAGSGGHRGVESIIKALKTKEFVRIRVGISPATPSGKLKKPDSKKIVDFVLGTFKPTEQQKLKKVKKMVEEALELLVGEGKDRAMNEINTR